VPETTETAVSSPGDLWLLGDHRVYCGDATQLESIEKVMSGGLADMVFCDPPYGVAYGSSARTRREREKKRITNDDLGDAAFGEFLRKASTNLLSVTKSAVYICMSSSKLHTLHKAFTAAGGHWSTFVIWAKNRFTLGRSDYQRQYEPMLYGWREGTDHFWCGARDQGNVWFVNKPQANVLHPTQKPVELVERAIRNSSKSRDTVLDPFGGSGTTLIACEKHGRQARLVELEPKYVDVVVRRWEQYTDRKATLAEDGRVFEQVADDRAAVASRIDRCRKEIAQVEELILAGHPDLQGLCLALSDWSAKLRVLQDEVRQREDSQPAREVGGLPVAAASGTNGTAEYQFGRFRGESGKDNRIRGPSPSSSRPPRAKVSRPRC
jgi:DNA modification methylase